MLSRRQLVKALGAAGGAFIIRGVVSAQAPQGPPVGPPSTVTIPPRDFGPNAPPPT